MKAHWEWADKLSHGDKLQRTLHDVKDGFAKDRFIVLTSTWRSKIIFINMVVEWVNLLQLETMADDGLLLNLCSNGEGDKEIYRESKDRKSKVNYLPKYIL